MRRRKTRKQKNDELKRRYDAVKNLMSTFAMSTVAVVAAVTLIPASPKAEITKVVALSEEIAYQVNITDEENALDLDTLVIVVENQLEYYETPISLGENSGYFEDLNSNTQYRLSVYGNKGFGDERLETTFVTTRQKVGATILSVNPTEETHSNNYNVDVSVYDPDTTYSNLTLYYGYSYEPETDLSYYSQPITSNRQLIEILNIMTSYPFHIYIEGTKDGENTILDEIWVTPSFELYADVYVAYYNNNQYAFHLYGDSYVIDLSYEVNVYKGSKLVQTLDYKPSNDYHDNNKLLIDGLDPETTYIISFNAKYTNPQTLRKEEKLILESEYVTAKDYNYQYSRKKSGEMEEVTITINDPDDVMQYIYYEVTYFVDDIEEFQLEGFNLEVIDDQEQASFTFMIPLVDKYELYIGLRNNTDHYIHEVIEEVIKD